MFGPSSRKSQIFVVHRLAAVRLETPIHPTGLFAAKEGVYAVFAGAKKRPSPAQRSALKQKKGRPMDDPFFVWLRLLGSNQRPND
jgi:hypothetical protein